MRSRSIVRLGIVLGAVAVTMALFASVASASTTIFTQSPSVGTKAATFHGYVSSNEFVWYGFQWGTTTAYGNETEFQGHDFTGSPGNLTTSVKVEGLQPNTTYHVQFAAVTYHGNLVLGEDIAFTTKSSTSFKAEQYPATVSAAQEAAGALKIGFEGEPLNCGSFTGTAGLSAASSTLAVSPATSECMAINAVSAAVKWNGCTMSFGAGDAGYADSSLSIACPEGKSVEVTSGTCGISIPAQSGLAVEIAENASFPASLVAKMSVSTLRYVKTNDGFGCKLNGTGTMENGTISGNLNLTATNSLNQKIGLHME